LANQARIIIGSRIVNLDEPSGTSEGSALTMRYPEFCKIHFSIAILTMLLIRPLAGQTFTNFHHFTSLNNQGVNTDGAYPTGDLILVGGAFYGTTSQGGTTGRGTVFKVNTNGTGFVVLHNFSTSDSSGKNSDGAYPLSGLALGGNTLYGTASGGGSAAAGTVFKINVDGSGFATLHSFTANDPATGTNSDGSAPWARLILSNGILYGTATQGGNAGLGTVFKFDTTSAVFTRLHSFSALDSSSLTNQDGANPLGGLIISGNILYGTAYRGGGLAAGTLYRLNTDGTGFATLLDSDGGPRAALSLSGNTLYGTTDSGGSLAGGSVFAVSTDGTGFTNLQSFTAGQGNGPWGGLLVRGSTLYGTTYGGGDLAKGSIFTINTDGTGFTNLYSFSGATDGEQPQAGLVANGDSLCGTTSQGGNSGTGTIFKLPVELPFSGSPELTISVVGNNVVLTWPANATGFNLQSTTNFAPTAIWNGVTPGPTVINGLNTVTNPIVGGQNYYRLGP
jgi:uncharacterized repeat protein (TIGR03803 family)